MGFESDLSNTQRKIFNSVIEGKISGALSMTNLLLDLLEGDELKNQSSISRQGMIDAIRVLTDKYEISQRRAMR